MYTVKKIVSVLMIIAAVAAMGGGVIYSLYAFGVVDFDMSLIFTASTISVIGGFATLGLSIISIILSCVAGARRPHAAFGIVGVLTGAVAFLMIPFMSLGSMFSFSSKFSWLVSSDFFENGSQFFGLGMAVFALIAMILAIADLVKTNRGE